MVETKRMTTAQAIVRFLTISMCPWTGWRQNLWKDFSPFSDTESL